MDSVFVAAARHDRVMVLPRTGRSSLELGR